MHQVEQVFAEFGDYSKRLAIIPATKQRCCMDAYFYLLDFLQAQRSEQVINNGKGRIQNTICDFSNRILSQEDRYQLLIAKRLLEWLYCLLLRA